MLDQLNQEGYRIFGATNGITKIQTGRMANSGIKDYFEHVFISDEVGYQKPDKAFMTPFLEPFHDLIRKKL